MNKRHSYLLAVKLATDNPYNTTTDFVDESVFVINSP
jgi:hypothetical protein